MTAGAFQPNRLHGAVPANAKPQPDLSLLTQAA